MQVSLTDFFDVASRHPALLALESAVRRSEPQTLRLSGLNATAKALYLLLLYKQTDRPMVLLVESNPVAEALCETLTAFHDLLDFSKHRGPPFVLPAHEVLPYHGQSPHPEVSERRGIGLWRIVEGAASIAVVPIRSALMKIPRKAFLRNLAWRIEIGDEFFVEDLLEGLASVGYEKQDPVEMVGQFSLRGGIIDVYSPEAPHPVRIEMLGDQVESIRFFDAENQKSIQRVDQALLLPLTEYPVAAPGQVDENTDGDAGDPELLPLGWEFSAQSTAARTGSILDLFDNPLMVWSERAAIQADSEKLWEKLEDGYEASGGVGPAPANFYFTPSGFAEEAQRGTQLLLEELAVETAGEPGLHLGTHPTPNFQGNVPHFVRELQAQVSSGRRALIAGHSPGDVERLADILTENEIGFQLSLKDPFKAASPYLEEKARLAGPLANVMLVESPIRRGVTLPDSNLVLYGHEDLFASSDLVARPKKGKSARSTFLSDLQDLKEGDLVVHAEHGIGRFVGLRQIEHAGRREDLMLIEYAERARLYLPLHRLDLIQKYHGAGGKPPPLDRMGGQTWSRTRARVKAKLLDMADELIKLHAARGKTPGFAFSADSNWQREFEEAFEFTETPDQIQSVKDIKKDMESDRPMDRLVCGDVGFGKTEVAMRAVFKALGDGKQVALLAPTTVLAFQHYETFSQRFASFPIEIKSLTRFRTRSQQKDILERLAEGRIDVLIGTHRLLSKDVGFSDLGLLIVDEEQRFGVRHKERLKQLTKNVDVLTLTATPIPRTLQMSLVGLRDISIIQTPPRDRLAIQTVIAPSSDQIIRDAIERELARKGQVYFIYNRVETIWRIAAYLQKLVPRARIGVGHGQMSTRDLEKVIFKFMRYEYDVLLSTTIVENGLDIPLANTMLIQRADLFGLSELYQLRGRVGRSNRRAYAYLLVDEDVELSSTARKRLAALREFSELGSGFKIAALDLELRGAGNLLGAEQHGQIAAVGFETYCRLLEEAMRKLEGEEVEEAARTTVKLRLDLHIPTDYIRDETQRLQAYKRLAEIRTREDRGRLLEELRDRYGSLPKPVHHLADHALVKSRAERMRIQSIERKRGRWMLRFSEDSRVDATRLMRFLAETPGVTFSPDRLLEWRWTEKQTLSAAAALKELDALLDRLEHRPETPATIV